MSESIAGVKAQLSAALDDNMDQMIQAAKETCAQRIARFSAALEGSNRDEAQALLSAHLVILQGLEQAQGCAGNGRGLIEQLVGSM